MINKDKTLSKGSLSLSSKIEKLERDWISGQDLWKQNTTINLWVITWMLVFGGIRYKF